MWRPYIQKIVTMKTTPFYWILPLFVLLIQCTSSIPTTYQAERPYAQYRDLADVLKYESALQVRGYGQQVQITVRRSTAGQGKPLYVVNGVPIGDNYQMVNDLVQLPLVRKISVSTSLTDILKYGGRGDKGVVEIWTN